MAADGQGWNRNIEANYRGHKGLLDEFDRLDKLSESRVLSVEDILSQRQCQESMTMMLQ